MADKHVHKYRRVNIGKGGKEYWVMKCFRIGCTHYTPMQTKLSAPLLRDTIAMCNRCEEEFILNKRALRMAEPCCDSCVKTKKDLTPELSFWEKLEKEAQKQ